MTSPDFDLRASIRSIPDYPKPGIMFRDITTLLGDARAFRRAVDEFVQPWAGMKIDKVAGIEARGFILGGAVAHQVSAGFVPIRKKGKLPHKRVSVAYALEYGETQSWTTPLTRTAVRVFFSCCHCRRSCSRLRAAREQPIFQNAAQACCARRAVLACSGGTYRERLFPSRR